MSEVSAVKIPAYNFHDPALWFTMCEATFELGTPKPVTESRTKYNYIISHLPPEAATIIRDIITNPHTTEPYEQVKKELIKRCGESAHREIKRLLSGELLGDRRPSELLRSMQRHAETHNVPDELMLELFLNHLPTSVQTILAAIQPLDLYKAAEIADRVMEVAPPTSVSTCSVSSVSSIEERLLAEIKKLHIRIDKLANTRGRNRSRSRSRVSEGGTRKTFDTCWYHFKFGEEAKKCISP